MENKNKIWQLTGRLLLVCLVLMWIDVRADGLHSWTRGAHDSTNPDNPGPPPGPGPGPDPEDPPNPPNPEDPPNPPNPEDPPNPPNPEDPPNPPNPEDPPNPPNPEDPPGPDDKKDETDPPVPEKITFEEGNEEKEDPGKDPCSATASPVYAATGFLIWTDVDFVLPGSPQLHISRTYNSHDPRNGLFGNGWSFNCGKSLHQYKKIDSEGHKTIGYRLRFGNGRRFDYIQREDGSIRTPNVLFKTLYPREDGTLKLKGRYGSYEIYRADGRLQKRGDRGGHVINYEYDQEGVLQQVADTNGRYLALTYHNQGQIATVKTHSGQEWQYDYDETGNLTKVTSPEGETSYEYKPYIRPGDGHTYYHLIKVTGPGGLVKIEVIYQKEKVERYTEEATYYNYRYDPDNNKVTKTEKYGKEWTYLYDDRGRIIEKTGPTGLRVQLTRNKHGQITQWKDSQGGWQKTFDELGRKTSHVDALGNVALWHYQGNSQRPYEVIRPGKITSYEYGLRGILTRRIEKDVETDKKQITTYSYDPKTRVRIIDGPRTDVSDIVKYHYDENGNRTSMTNALGQSTHIVYDEDNRPIEIQSINGSVSQLKYDALGRLLRLDNEGKITEYAYSETGRLKQLKRANGYTKNYNYDLYDRLVEIADNRGERVKYNRDAYGNILRENLFHSNNQQVKFQSWKYDKLNRIIKELGNTSTYITNEYDERSNLIKTLDGLNKQTHYRYDALDRLLKVTDALGGESDYQYDDQGNLIEVTDPNGHITQYQYDGFGNQIKTISPDTGEAKYTYDAKGNLLSETDAKNQTTQYQYDALNRLFNVQYADKSLVTYTYDQGENGVGRLSRIDEPSSHLTWQYNQRGQVLEKARQQEK